MQIISRRDHLRHGHADARKICASWRLSITTTTTTTPSETTVKSCDLDAKGFPAHAFLLRSSALEFVVRARDPLIPTRTGSDFIDQTNPGTSCRGPVEGSLRWNEAEVPLRILLWKQLNLLRYTANLTSKTAHPTLNGHDQDTDPSINGPLIEFAAVDTGLNRSSAGTN